MLEGASAQQRGQVDAALAAGPDSPLALEILSRLADGKPAPAWASVAAVAACAAWPATDSRPMARAMAGVRSREAMRALIALARRSSDGAACFEALTDLTGREDVRPDADEWAALLAQAESWSEETWWRTLAGWQSERARRRASEQQQASVRLMETLRQVHLSTPPAERSRLLATLLKDALPEVRRAGIELALLELASARTLGPAVADGAIPLLSDPDESIRAGAAGLLLQLAPAGAADVAAAALALERSPGVAAPLLKLAVRGDQRPVIDQALAWLEDPARGSRESEAVRACRDAAVDLAWQLTRRGVMNDEPDRARVLSALRRIPLPEASAGCLQLRGLLGGPSDIQDAATLLTSKDASQRLGAAETVVARPEHLDALLEAAKGDARLVEVAVRGVTLHRQTAAGFIGIERATADKPELRRAALAAVADILPAPEVLDAIESLSAEPDMRESVLSTLARRERITSERVDPVRARAIADGLVRLARLRLTLDKPADAVAALDALKLVGVEPDAAESARLRTLAFIRLDRPEDALAAGSDAEAWLEAIASIAEMPFAPRILAAMETGFGAAMTEEQLARLESLRRRILPPPVGDEPAESAPR